MDMARMPGPMMNSSSSYPQKKKPTMGVPKRGGFDMNKPTFNVGPSPNKVPGMIGTGPKMPRTGMPGRNMGPINKMPPPVSPVLYAGGPGGGNVPPMIPSPPIMDEPMMPPPSPMPPMMDEGNMQFQGGGMMRPPMQGGSGEGLWGKYNQLNNPAQPMPRRGGMFGNSMRAAGGMFGR